MRERSERDSVTSLRKREAHMITSPLVFKNFHSTKNQLNNLMNHSKKFIIASHRMKSKEEKRISHESE
jgi:hypothetical protein